MKCRHCDAELELQFIDLGTAPPSNAYICEEDKSSGEVYLPLKVMVCKSCWLVQTEDYVSPENLFKSNYAYLSSTSKSWCNHAKKYFEEIVPHIGATQKSFVVELASNDGYLLKNFVSAGIPCLGIEPTEAPAKVAAQLGVESITDFFSLSLAIKIVQTRGCADLIIANNVYAHVPNINDFTRGIKHLLGYNGVVTIEFPSVQNLVLEKQFDTVYHEHYSYLSLLSVRNIFHKCGLRIYDVVKLSTHGGSLRVYGCHNENDNRKVTDRALAYLKDEEMAGVNTIGFYSQLQREAERIKCNFLKYLIRNKEEGKSVVAYGAAAKGNTLLNYSGIRTDLISYVCDNAKSKQYMYTPGARIPIYPASQLRVSRPDTVIILPWNIADEIETEINFVREWGAEIVVCMPEIRVL